MVYVADRQNRRIQIFDGEGTYVKEWAYKGLPCGLYLHPDGTLYMVSGFAGEILELDENGRAVGGQRPARARARRVRRGALHDDGPERRHLRRRHRAAGTAQVREGVSRQRRGQSHGPPSREAAIKAIHTGPWRTASRRPSPPRCTGGAERVATGRRRAARTARDSTERTPARALILVPTDEGRAAAPRTPALQSPGRLFVARDTQAPMPSDPPLTLDVADCGPVARACVELRPLTVFVGPSNTGKSWLATLAYALHRYFGAVPEWLPRYRLGNRDGRASRRRARGSPPHGGEGVGGSSLPGRGIGGGGRHRADGPDPGCRPVCTSRNRAERSARRSSVASVSTRVAWFEREAQETRASGFRHAIDGISTPAAHELKVRDDGWTFRPTVPDGLRIRSGLHAWLADLLLTEHESGDRTGAPDMGRRRCADPRDAAEAPSGVLSSRGADQSDERPRHRRERPHPERDPGRDPPRRPRAAAVGRARRLPAATGGDGVEPAAGTCPARPTRQGRPPPTRETHRRRDSRRGGQCRGPARRPPIRTSPICQVDGSPGCL